MATIRSGSITTRNSRRPTTTSPRYRWLDRRWRADAIVHLGKHGTLEWLPGKMLALMPSCAPDVALGVDAADLPVRRQRPRRGGTGEATRPRGHGRPPGAADDAGRGYDELAELEALMDDYARLEVLDPAEAAGARRRGSGPRSNGANLQDGPRGSHERPVTVGVLVAHLDGYLCEVKDVQIKDGLHVLGRRPRGSSSSAVWSPRFGRHGSGEVPGLRRAVAASVRSSTSRRSSPRLGRQGRRCPTSADTLIAPALRGTAYLRQRPRSTSLEAAQHAAARRLATQRVGAGVGARGHAPMVLGREDAGVISALRFAAADLVPRLHHTHRRARPTCAGAARPPHRPPGRPARRPAGGPTCSTTGRNFYSVDPRALPSELSWRPPAGLADALLERHREGYRRAAER